MRAHSIGIFILGVFLHPQYAAALDGAVAVSSISTSSTLQSAPARSANAPQTAITHPHPNPPLKGEGENGQVQRRMTAAIRDLRAVFAGEPASRDARHIADWVMDSGDNRGLPFVIIDKTEARIFVFDAGGWIVGAAPALLGLARGDDTVPGIGDRELSAIRPEERTTPAGRFVAQLGMSSRGEDVVWVDYDSGVSLHRVVTSNPRERRLERLATPTPADNRISYGCINVPAAFYDKVVVPAFTGTVGIVYILPETRPAAMVFGIPATGDGGTEHRPYAGGAAPP
jgi:hypothetical protein